MLNVLNLVAFWSDPEDSGLLVFAAAVMHFDFVIDAFILEQLLHRIDATG